MGEELVTTLERLRVDVTHREYVELLPLPTAGGIDGEQDRPCYAQAHEADGGADSEVAQEEVGVEGLLSESVGIRDLPEGAKPVE
jgi:hypothetical protein